jgi:hypothetical protein
MGLDQYAFRVDENGERTEIACWRKHNRLQGWMENLWYETRKNTEEFNCVDMELNWEDVMQLATDIEKRNLPDTQGFFYGSDSYSYIMDSSSDLGHTDYQDLNADLQFIETSKMALDCGDKVVYTCWY